jgi:hypothetical protein
MGASGHWSAWRRARRAARHKLRGYEEGVRRGVGRGHRKDGVLGLLKGAPPPALKLLGEVQGYHDAGLPVSGPAPAPAPLPAAVQHRQRASL